MVKFLLTLFGSSATLIFFSFSLPFSNTNDPNQEISQMIDPFIEQMPSLPRYMEGGYFPLGRAPITDFLLSNPSYIAAYGSEIATLIKEESTKNSLSGLESTLMTAAGMPLLLENEAIKESEIPDAFLKAFTKPVAHKLFNDWQNFLKIEKRVRRILQVLSEEEKSWIREHFNEFFFATAGEELKYDFFTAENPTPFKFYTLAARLDLADLASCSTELSRIADAFHQDRQMLAAIQLTDDWIYEDQGLVMFVSTRSQTEHHQQADLFIDLGGSNTIHGSAGGTEGKRTLALHLDLKGNNRYEGTHFCQGSGFLGVGGFYSCAGNNHFLAKSYPQGCGFFGSGFLVNQGGNNQFTADFGSQSFALFGTSLLWNPKGTNQYIATQGMSQAASSTLGIAYLIDLEGGNHYTSGELGKGGTLYGGIGQGGSTGFRFYPWLNNPSLYGGFSYLFLGGGSNDLKTAWLGQGSAYFLGVGIVFSEGSHNRFTADYDSQGQGLHLAAGLLITKGDYNQFKGGWGSLGTGGDRSAGILINEGSHNHFEGADQSIGTSRKPRAIGIFMSKGDNNQYTFGKTSNARIQFPESPNEWSSALFLDFGNNNRFTENVDELNRGAHRNWGINNHSLGLSSDQALDLPYKSQKTSSNFDIHGWEENTAYRPSKSSKDISELKTASYDRRRQIYEAYDQARFQDRKQDVDLSPLLLNPGELPEDLFNYTVLWALRNKQKTDLTAIKRDLDLGKFHSNYARKMAVSLVGTYWTPASNDLLQKIMLEDPTDEVRYYAALALAIHLPNESINLLEPGVNSQTEMVRYAIAKGLQESANPAALSLIKPLLNDESFYVRRAAGMTALSLGDKQGVDAVMGTLQIDTLDTTDNYGDNIFRQLAEYLGVDFGLDKQAWIEWWNLNQKTFQLPQKPQADS